jgi:hypothetical protein
MVAPTTILSKPSDLHIELGHVRDVYGFCQSPVSAPLVGGWLDANLLDANQLELAKSTARQDGVCHKGLISSSNFSLLSSSACPLTDDATSACTCLGVSQCGKGNSCKVDCSCKMKNPPYINVLRTGFYHNETMFRLLGNQRARPLFVGALKFDDGTSFNLTCELNTTSYRSLFPKKYLHGYEVVTRGVGEKDRRCSPDQDLTMHSIYECKIVPVLKDQPLEVGDVFAQRYVFESGSGGRCHSLFSLVFVVYLLTL